MNEEIKKNLKNTNAWLRLIFMVLFIFLYSIAIMVLWVVVFLQIVFNLFTASPNSKILPFSSQLSKYIYEILLYLSFNSEEKPFPFGDWPGNKKDTATVVKPEE